MHGDNLLFQAFIYLLAAVAAVPIAKRLGLGSVLGYLLAGIAIGPAGLKLVGQDRDVLHFAEFGVVMMLFLVGLELRPALLWKMRRPILGMGGAQVLGTAVLTGAAAWFWLHSWPAALGIGLILAMSSTAIVLQSLTEKAQLKSQGGEACFSVLLFQDIAVIPILALLPILASVAQGKAPTAASEGPLAHLPGWLQAVVTLAAVAVIVVGGRFLLRPLFRYIAATKLREVFTATALLLVIGIALLMQSVGLSAALGTFLAGVVLAESEYRHQLEADVEPFKGLLLGLFFIAVGAGIDFRLMAERPGEIASVVLLLIALKFAVLLLVGRQFGIEKSQAFLFAFALAQGGEFCFVLLSTATQQGLFDATTAKTLVASVAVSMMCAPLLFTVNEKLIQPRFSPKRKKRAPDVIDEHDNPVILAGFGRFGHVIGRLLRAHGFATTVLDNDPDQVTMLAQFGLKSFYGDASRLDLLHTAGAEKGRLFILAIDDEVRSLEIVKTIRQHFPNLRIMARAVSRQHAYELIRLGVKQVYRDTFGSALDLSHDALQELGFQPEQAQRAVQIFKERDEVAVHELAGFQGDQKEYVSRARQHMENLERILQSDLVARTDSRDGVVHSDSAPDEMSEEEQREDAGRQS